MVSDERSKASATPSHFGRPASGWGGSQSTVTVSHTPLTETEDPGTQSSNRRWAHTVTRPSARSNTPVASTIPVNIGHHLQVPLDPLHRADRDGQRVRDAPHSRS